MDYIGGNIFIKTDLIYSFITIKGFGKYILSIIFNDKILFILLINFCSRAQKLKLKTEYKNEIKDVNWLFSNFLFSFLGYFIIYSIIGLINFFYECCYKSCCIRDKEKKGCKSGDNDKSNEDNENTINDNNNMNEPLNSSNNNDDKNKENPKEVNNSINNKENKKYNINEDNERIEKFILWALFILFILIFVESIFFYWNIKNVINTKILYKRLIYASIALTGSVNFLLYDFYSCQKIEYISLSGVVSLSQLAFRLIELILEFKPHSFYLYIQFFISIAVLILSFVLTLAISIHLKIYKYVLSIF